MAAEAPESTVRMQIVVEAPVERAFRVFTEKFDLIKPREHNMLQVEIAETVFEPRVGGAIYDRGVGWQAERDVIKAPDGWPLYLKRFAEVLST